MSFTHAPRSAVSPSVLHLDAGATVARMEAGIRDIVFRRLKRKGAVLGLSGGIDSAVVAALCARALGKDRVLGLLMPEADSDGDSLRLGQFVADTLGIRAVVEDITPMLAAARCYERRDEAIRTVLPDYGPGYKCKIVLPDMRDARYAIFSVVVQAPDGTTTKARLPLEAYLAIVAATNFKQRTRKMLEYHYADLCVYAVAGTPNRLEYDQGFFVKNGDGAADIKPIAHLFKTQVYQLAEYLEVPEEIRRRPPTTDTYSLPQSQEEFYFALPYREMDLCLWGKDNGIPAADLAPATGLPAEVIERMYATIDSRRKAARYLHEPPVLLGAVAEAASFSDPTV